MSVSVWWKRILYCASLGSFLTLGAPLIVKVEMDKRLAEKEKHKLAEKEKQQLAEKEKPQSKAEIEQSIKDVLLEVDQDFKNELAVAKASFFRIYKHDPAFMELYLRQSDQLRPGIKRNFKDFLFSKKVFTKEDMKKILNDFNAVKQKMNFDESTVHADNYGAGIMKQIDEYNRINEPNIEHLYLNYPEFAELKKKIKHQQELISINSDLLHNAQELIQANYQSDKSNIQECLNKLKHEIQTSKTEIESLETESNTKHPSAKQAIYAESQKTFETSNKTAVTVFYAISTYIIDLFSQFN